MKLTRIFFVTGMLSLCTLVFGQLAFASCEAVKLSRSGGSGTSLVAAFKNDSSSCKQVKREKALDAKPKRARLSVSGGSSSAEWLQFKKRN